MLPKKNRADKKVVEEVFKSGKFINSNNFSLKYMILKTRNSLVVKKEAGLQSPKPLLLKNNPKISVLVPKSLAKKAIKRNYLRRLGYIALEKQLHHFPTGLTGVLIFKKYQDDILTIENEIKNIINKIH